MLKIKLMLSQLSTKLELKLKLKPSLAIIRLGATLPNHIPACSSYLFSTPKISTWPHIHVYVLHTATVHIMYILCTAAVCVEHKQNNNFIIQHCIGCQGTGDNCRGWYAGLEKLGIRGIQDTRQFAFS